MSLEKFNINPGSKTDAERYAALGFNSVQLAMVLQEGGLLQYTKRLYVDNHQEYVEGLLGTETPRLMLITELLAQESDDLAGPISDREIVKALIGLPNWDVFENPNDAVFYKRYQNRDAYNFTKPAKAKLLLIEHLRQILTTRTNVPPTYMEQLDDYLSKLRYTEAETSRVANLRAQELSERLAPDLKTLKGALQAIINKVEGLELDEDFNITTRSSRSAR